MPQAATRSGPNCGINTDRVKMICFMVTSLLAGLAGMLTISRLPLTPGNTIIGRNLELDILAGVVIGGVSFYGGRGSAVGTFFGVMFIQLVQSGLVIAGFDSYLQTPVLGFLLLIAAVVDVLRHRQSELASSVVVQARHRNGTAKGGVDALGTRKSFTRSLVNECHTLGPFFKGG